MKTGIDADRLQLLLERMYTGELNRSEEQELRELMLQPGAGKILSAVDINMRSIDEEERFSDSPFNSDAGFAALFQNAQSKEIAEHAIHTTAKVKSIRGFSWLWVAAALLAVLVGGPAVYKMYIRKPADTVASVKPAPVSDFAPGSNKAWLTLGNGSKILLDTAKNGAIATDGSSQVIKQRDGQLAYQQGNAGGANTFNTLEVPKGGQYKLTLPDGTQVWLNSASSLRYPTQFGNDNREVTLTGEAYFEVAHVTAAGKRVPFHVKITGANGLPQDEVEVLGTHFNIKAYAEEGLVKTSLLEGSVKVNHQGITKVITPGEQAVVSAGKKDIRVSEEDMSEVTAWKQGMFAFNETPIQEIMAQVGRWYNVEVEFQAPVSLDFTGTLNRDLPVSRLLHLLDLTGKVKFTLVEGKVIVTPL
ncbi:FecR family protein [Deminuibacter soli]|uniref:FecR family protein n=1 Tax=Deminuibacter soli TaxID=2291815 RepID=A0A3E1NIR5_9BACT|nr:FecR family protein [Deminuibacter soli]RFM27833.1 FecR family protein [Deminuibacter soli]